MAKPAVRIEGIATKRQVGKQFQKARQEIATYLKTKGANKIINELEDTVEDWTNPPNFKATVSYLFQGSHIRLTVKPTGPGTANWIRVNDGTGPRVLTSRKGLMNFYPEYDPKTRPGGFYGGSGNRGGDKVYGRRSVGIFKPHRIEPRKFTEEVLKIVDDDIKSDINDIIRRNI